MTDYKAIASVLINASKEKVWQALTDPKLVKKYFYGTNLIITWVKGTPIIFRGEWEGKTYEDKGNVIEFIPEQKLVYNYWSTMSGLADKPELYQILTYELSEEAGGVKVWITQENIDSESKIQHSQESWKNVLEGLKKLVEEGA